MPKVALPENLPTIEGFEIRSCAIEGRGKGEARITLVIVADHTKRQAKIVTLVKRTVSRLEVYSGYQRWFPNSQQLAINVSCRDDESLVQTARAFLTLLVEAIAAQLAAEAEVKAKSYKGRPPAPQRRPRQQYSVR